MRIQHHHQTRGGEGGRACHLDRPPPRHICNTSKVQEGGGARRDHHPAAAQDLRLTPLEVLVKALIQLRVTFRSLGVSMNDVDASVTLESLVVHVGIRGNLTDAAVLQAVDSIAFSEDVRLEESTSVDLSPPGLPPPPEPPPASCG